MSVPINWKLGIRKIRKILEARGLDLEKYEDIIWEILQELAFFFGELENQKSVLRDKLGNYSEGIQIILLWTLSDIYLEYAAELVRRKRRQLLQEPIVEIEVK